MQSLDNISYHIFEGYHASLPAEKTGEGIQAMSNLIVIITSILESQVNRLLQNQ